MSDIKQQQRFLVPETNEVKKKWLECSIQEKKSQIQRLKQDIEDLQRGQIVKLEATILMLQKELNHLQERYNIIDKVIDI